MIKETTFRHIAAQYQAYSDSIRWNSAPATLYEPFEYIMHQEGKKLRPISLLLAYGLFKEDTDSIMPAAYGIELFHNFTLVHDDIMDQAGLRRGRPTVHVQFSPSEAILSGDAMLLESLRYLSECPGADQDLLNFFIRTGIEVCRGQAMDMQFENNILVRKEDYLEMIRLKTSVLLAACLRMGAKLAGQPESICDDLYRLGIDLGTAFQIQDDLLDLYGQNHLVGKTRGGDLIQRKKTILLLTAIEELDDMQKAEQTMHYQSPRSPEDQVSYYEAFFDQMKVREKVEDSFESFRSRCENLIQSMNINLEGRQQLTNFMHLVLNRKS